MIETAISDEILGAIRSADNEAKAKIWCALNRDEWPKELSNLKPENFDDMPIGERLVFVWELMEEVINDIGLKSCLREWNRDMLPGNQFDTWWGNGKK